MATQKWSTSAPTWSQMAAEPCRPQPGVGRFGRREERAAVRGVEVGPSWVAEAMAGCLVAGTRLGSGRAVPILAA